MPYLGRLVILWSTSSPAHRIVLIFWQEVQSCLSAHDFYAESLGQLKGQQVPRSWWRGHPKRYFKTTKFPIFQGKVMKSRLVNQYDSPIDISKNTPYIDAQEVREGSWSFRLIWPSFFVQNADRLPLGYHTPLPMVILSMGSFSSGPTWDATDPPMRCQEVDPDSYVLIFEKTWQAASFAIRLGGEGGLVEGGWLGGGLKVRFFERLKIGGQERGKRYCIYNDRVGASIGDKKGKGMETSCKTESGLMVDNWIKLPCKGRCFDDGLIILGEIILPA